MDEKSKERNRKRKLFVKDGRLRDHVSKSCNTSSVNLVEIHDSVGEGSPAVVSETNGVPITPTNLRSRKRVETFEKHDRAGGEAEKNTVVTKEKATGYGKAGKRNATVDFADPLIASSKNLNGAERVNESSENKVLI